MYVNGKRITEESHPVKDGDVLQMGVPLGKGQPAEFVWKFQIAKQMSDDAKENKIVLTENNRKRARPDSGEAVAGPSGVKTPSKKPKLKRLDCN